MSRADRETRIRDGIQGLLAGGELELVDVEFGGSSRGMLIRVLVDRPGGVSVEDCARVSRAVGDHLEALEAIAGRYVLEVSSPGVNRPLRKREDFSRFAGEAVEIVTVEKIEDRRDHRGILEGFDPERDLVLLRGEDGEARAIPLGVIRRAELRRDPWQGRRGRRSTSDSKQAKRKR